MKGTMGYTNFDHVVFQIAYHQLTGRHAAEALEGGADTIAALLSSTGSPEEAVMTAVGCCRLDAMRAVDSATRQANERRFAGRS